MRQMATYDMMETMRVANQWMGATAKAMFSLPAFGLAANPAMQMTMAWGEVTERSFARMQVKPDWNIGTVVGADGRDHPVEVKITVPKPFGDLIQFSVSGRAPMKRKVLLVAPMSGHYATLLRSTVVSLLPDCDVYTTDWHNARDIPVSVGKFDIEDYTLYLAEFMRELGPDIHVIAVCQPAPLALAATAYLAEEDPKAQPNTLTLIGGPIDPEAAPTEVTDFGRSVTMGQLEKFVLQRVGFKYAGAGRMVYPGLQQLASFMAMNAEMHSKAFSDQVIRVAKGEAGDQDRHNKFYDEYLAVMDMTAEFYMSTVERVFKEREIAKNVFTINGKAVDISKITDVAVKTVEGANDDISAPGQCIAALDLLTGLPDAKKASHVEPDAGHYGIFAGRSWRNNIRPLVLEFFDANGMEASTAKPAEPKTPVAKPAAVAPAQTTKAAPKPAAKKAKKEPAAKPAAAKAKAPAKPAPAPKPAAPKAAESKPEAKPAAKPASKTAAQKSAAPKVATKAAAKKSPAKKPAARKAK
ncbi:polyhydroxyalkanoate depolymerase [Alphaproteobacteria bacterium KMM 3653]|uniref:Polyhydroxyalkanoate depolymerase n=1 Tax=Harenicola maris TaxID=2841044 RepID=A0AAP2G5Q0_9RHOB|nr:polyhydroxyalkanoate depolymerase [Harenicola maris]